MAMLNRYIEKKACNNKKTARICCTRTLYDCNVAANPRIPADKKSDDPAMMQM